MWKEVQKILSNKIQLQTKNKILSDKIQLQTKKERKIIILRIVHHRKKLFKIKSLKNSIFDRAWVEKNCLIKFK